MAKLPVFKLTIRKDAPDTGADYVALVDEPAIEKYFLAFGRDKPIPQHFTSEEQRIITGPVMIPDLPIYRAPSTEIPEEHYVVFDADTIRQILYRFSKQGNFNNVNQMHEAGTDPKDVYLIESFVSDSARGVTAPEPLKDCPEGTWFMSYKIDNDEVWAKVKEGKFRGLSIEGIFAYVDTEEQPEEETPEQKLLSQLAELLEENAA